MLLVFFFDHLLALQLSCIPSRLGSGALDVGRSPTAPMPSDASNTITALDSRLYASFASRDGWSPISGPPGIRARLLLIWILVDVAGYGVMGVAALGSVFGRSAITQR